MIIFNQEPFRSASQSKEQRWAPRIKRQSPWQRSRWDQVWPGSDQGPKMTRPVLIWPLLGSPNISISSHTGIPRWCSLNPRPSTNWRKLRTSLSLNQGNPSYQLTGIKLQINDFLRGIVQICSQERSDGTCWTQDHPQPKGPWEQVCDSFRGTRQGCLQVGDTKGYSIYGDMGGTYILRF